MIAADQLLGAELEGDAEFAAEWTELAPARGA